MLYFNNCDIQVNGIGLMAQNAHLTSSNSLRSIKPIGRSKGLETSPEGPVTNNFTATYWINIDKDPCYQEVLKLKDLFVSKSEFDLAQPQVIEVAGLSGAFYMNSYKGFEEMSGNVSPRDEVLEYVDSFSGLAHSWTTFIESDAGSLDIPILEFDYNFASRMTPVYALGAKTPVQVLFTNFEETIKMQKDIERQIKFYGESGCALFDSCANDPKVKIFKLGYLCDDSLTDTMEFGVSGYRINSNSITVDTNDFVKSEFTITKTS